MVPETNLRVLAQINWWNRLPISLGRFFRWSAGSNLRGRPLGGSFKSKPYVGGAAVSESFRLEFRRLLSRSIVRDPSRWFCPNRCHVRSWPFCDSRPRPPSRCLTQAPICMAHLRGTDDVPGPALRHVCKQSYRGAETCISGQRAVCTCLSHGELSGDFS